MSLRENIAAPGRRVRPGKLILRVTKKKKSKGLANKTLNIWSSKTHQITVD
jgi:hypothetical protein